MGVVSNGVALKGVGLQDLDCTINFFEPSGVARRKDGVRIRPLGTGNPINRCARIGFHVVR